ncbi:MAG: SPOR domain-containing protein [Acidobacteriota bacterium]
MKRALSWYLAIVVVMAGGLFLVLELFVNNSDSAGVGVPEKAAVLTAAEGQPGAETTAGRTGTGVPEVDNGTGVFLDKKPVSGSGSFRDRSVPTADQSMIAASPEQERSNPASAALAASPGADSGSYTVQVAALASRDKAAGVVDKLRNDGFSAGRIGRDLGDSLNRVWVGSFATRVEAVAMAEKLKGKGYNTYVRAVQ